MFWYKACLITLHFLIKFMTHLNNCQLWQLRSCFLAEFGCSIFACDFKINEVLAQEHATPETGVAEHGTKKVPWAYKSVVEVVTLWLSGRFKYQSEQTGKVYSFCVQFSILLLLNETLLLYFILLPFVNRKTETYRHCNFNGSWQRTLTPYL